MKYPEHIQHNLSTDSKYYSLYSMENIERCKIDADYLGDTMLVNEDMIWHSVHKYVGKPEVIVANYRVDKDDILQLGRLGFFKAIKAFDTGRGIKFSSFAVTTIVREIKCYLRDSASIFRPTRTANELIQRISRLESELGYMPNLSDVAIMLDEQEERVKKAVQVGKTVKYLDETVSSRQSVGMANTVTLLDMIPDDVHLEASVLDKVLIDSVINSIKENLSTKEESVLRTRIEGYNQTQTADKERISQMRVSRIMKKVAALLVGMDETIKGE
jgi:RNA polymerase sporulation-specific sigma factor